jgi:hypothetical protein
MKSLLFLAIVGAAIYAVLLYSNPLPDPNSVAVAVQAKETPASVSQPSSWGSNIGSLKPQIVSVDKPPARWYDRKPSQPLRYADETESADKAKPQVAASKPKTATAGMAVSRPKPQSSSRAEVRRADVRPPRLSRRAERRARKAYNNRAFLLGR